MDLIDKYDLQEITITEIIEILGREDDRKLSSKTKKEYVKIFKRLESKNYEDFYEGSKQYFYKKKAALSYCIHIILESGISKLCKPDLDHEKYARIISKADDYIYLYYKYCQNTGVSPVKQKPPTKNSKRQSISRMGEFWREQIWAECENSDYKGAVAVLDLIGARPCEIENGVLVEWEEGSSYLTFTVKGGKIDAEEKNGQKIRTIKVNLSTGCHWGSPKNYLMNQCFEYGYCKIKAHPKRLDDYVRRISEKIWPRKKNQISPYSYRHQISADIKKDGVSKIMTAKTMGHRSTRSQKHYGTARQGRRRNSIVEVECSDHVRTHNSKYNSNPTSIQGGKQDLVKGQ